MRAQFDELSTFKAAEDSRRASLPQTAEAYEVKLPENFTPPAGIEFKLDLNDPLYAMAKEAAHAKGMSQGDFSDLLGLFASAKVQEAAVYETAKAENLKALGTTGPQRIDAVTRWLAANFDDATVKPVLATLATTAHVTMFEKIISKLTSQGSGTFTPQHRDMDTGKVDDATWARMSYSERKAYSAKHSGQAA